MTYLLGLDLGTSSVKTLLVEENGQIAGRGSAEYPIQTPQPGQAEQNPDEWWQACQAAVRQALAEAERPVDVAAIGLCGQMHGTVLLDNQDHLLAPAVIWPDQRSPRQVQEITQLVGAERLIELSGSPAATGFQAATVRWFQQEQPEIWRRVRRVLLPKDYLRWRLTGDFATDASDGSGTLLLDVRSRDWSGELLAALDINLEQLPPVKPSIAMAGELRPDAASLLGLPPRIPVITGAGDTPASLLGAGVTGPESLLVNISTGGQLALPAFIVEVDKAGRMHTFCSALEPTQEQAGWYKMGATLSAGQSLRWLRDNVFRLEGEGAYQKMTAWASEVPPGARRLIFLPYLSGERSPLMDPLARGMFLGLTLQHGRPELVRAVLEGVTFSCYEACRVLIETGASPARVILAGGGARSPLWGQIVADVFNLPVQRLKTTEQSALGAVLLAGAGIGLLDPGTTSRLWAEYHDPLEPKPHNHTLYMELLPLFREAYWKLKEHLPG